VGPPPLRSEQCRLSFFFSFFFLPCLSKLIARESDSSPGFSPLRDTTSICFLSPLLPSALVADRGVYSSLLYKRKNPSAVLSSPHNRPPLFLPVPLSESGVYHRRRQRLFPDGSSCVLFFKLRKRMETARIRCFPFFSFDVNSIPLFWQVEIVHLPFIDGIEHTLPDSDSPPPRVRKVYFSARPFKTLAPSHFFGSATLARIPSGYEVHHSFFFFSFPLLPDVLAL